MAITGEKYTAIECQADIDKHELLQKIHGVKYQEVIHATQGLLHNTQ